MLITLVLTLLPLPGKADDGHFGTLLTDAEKADLVEYLKSLRADVFNLI